MLSGLRTTVQVFVTHPNSGIKNIKDLEKKLKTNKSLTIGIGNPAQRMVWDQLFDVSARSTQTVMVPYKGASSVLRDIAGGHIDLTYLPISVVKSNIDSGNLISGKSILENLLRKIILWIIHSLKNMTNH
jgi:tripartite-type tricarboxylate transporter receptor subunit TctC